VAAIAVTVKPAIRSPGPSATPLTSATGRPSVIAIP